MAEARGETLHEFAIAQNIVKAVEGVIKCAEPGAGDEKFCRVIRQSDRPHVAEISLEIGAMTGIVADSLLFSFGFVSKGTAAEGATLDIVMKPITACCSLCGLGYDVTRQHFQCPKCGGKDFRITGGRELLITGVETG